MPWSLQDVDGMLNSKLKGIVCLYTRKTLQLHKRNTSKLLENTVNGL